MESIINKYCLKDVPFSRIQPSKLNTFSPTDISELAQSLQSVGLIHALCVCDTKSGEYEILAGERRYRAIDYVQKNKDRHFYENVPCLVIDNDFPDTLKQLIIELSNLEQRDFDKMKHRMQVVEIVQKAIEDENLSRRQGIQAIATYMQTSQRYADMYLTVAQRGSQNIKDMFVSGKIPASLASNAAHLDETHQQEFTDRVNNGEKPKAVIDDIYQAQCTASVPHEVIKDDPEPSSPDKTSSFENSSNNTDSLSIFSNDIPSPTISAEPKSTYKPTATPANNPEPQYTDAEIFEMNNEDFDEGNDSSAYGSALDGFAYVPNVDLTSQSAELDTTGRLGTVHRSRANGSEGDDVEKLQNSVRRNLETIKRMTEILTDADIDFLDYVGDWVEEMRTLA